MTPLRLYVDDRYPAHWIAEHEGALWRFPGENDGWSRRVAYGGRASQLREVGAYNGAGTGWPGSKIPASPSTGSA